VSRSAERGLAMDKNNLIEINPEVMMGKPVIRGTRIPVEIILEKLDVSPWRSSWKSWPPAKPRTRYSWRIRI